ncbi:galactonate dehydratase [Ruania alba]|uniref:Galactonate dehydratase n=2 Tax=Ruania alba TaxID=648782 RepID=A0A1H5N0U1_9MICO|nr:galactonate dehydratase [Ruania alba]
MHVRQVETFVLKIDGGVGYQGVVGQERPDGYHVRPPWRSLYSSRFESLLVRVTAEDGTVGWGEALAPVAPEVPRAVVDLLLAPVLVGLDATMPRRSWCTLRDLMRERGHLVGHQADALAAVDIALWDLAGRLAGRSIPEIAGGAFRDEVPTYVSGLPGVDDAHRADLAREWIDRGANAIKLHLGHGVDSDLATFDAVRAAVPDVRLAVDAHWVYPFHDALRLADGLAERDGWFLEAPLMPEDLAAHAELGRRSRVPIAVGEAMRNRYEFQQWFDAGAIGIAQPDIGRTGMTEGLVIAELAAARHLPVAPHHSSGLGLALAAGLCMAAAAETTSVFEYQVASTEIGSRILRNPIEVRSNAFTPPHGPGLGVDVDEEAVRRLAEVAG